MPVDLATLAAPHHTAIVVSEMKRITVGDLVATNSPTSPGAPLQIRGNAGAQCTEGDGKRSSKGFAE